MENVKIIENGVSGLLEYSSGKKIKVSGEKLGLLKGKRPVSVVEEPAVEVQIDDSFEARMPEFKKPEMTLESAFFGNIMGAPNKNEIEVGSINPPVIEKKEEKIEKPAYRPGEYVVPDIKGPNNISVPSTPRVDRSEEFRKMLNTVDTTSVVGKVLVSGVSRLDKNGKDQARIKAYIEQLDIKIANLEKARDSISAGKQDIEDLLSKTTQISLTEIRQAASLDSSSRANLELAKIKESIDNIQKIKDEEETKLQKLVAERERLEEERANQKTKLMSAEKNKIEICDSIERDLGTATQIEKLEKEQEQLRSKLSLVEEEPKKVVDIVNPFDKMRVMQSEVSEESIRRAA